MITNLEKLEYENKLSTLGVNFTNVLGIHENIIGVKTILSRELNIMFPTLSNALSGKHNSPQIIYQVHEYLKNKSVVAWAVNLTIEEKRYDNLLNNGFSVWEAIQIAKE